MGRPWMLKTRRIHSAGWRADGFDAAAGHVDGPPRAFRLRTRELDGRRVDVAMLEADRLTGTSTRVGHEHDERRVRIAHLLPIAAL